MEKRKDILSLLVILFPSLLIALTAGMVDLYGLVIRVLLLGYQFVILKNFLDDYYGN
tara:strand:- start:328 stop:498 length:171 start_codon:yes stop_codon:yes gene_type:complete